MSGPSSTFSSERAPAGEWARVFVAGLLGATVALLAWEALLRSRGYGPGVTDNAVLWSAARIGPARSPHAIAFVGDSRVQLDVDLDVVARALPPMVPAQLAIPATNPVPVLEDLAADPAFLGVAVVGYNPGLLFREAGPVWETPREYVEASRTHGAFVRSEAALEAAVEQTAALRQPYLALPALLRIHRWPPAPHVTTRRDRARRGDFGRAPDRVLLPLRTGPRAWGPMLGTEGRAIVVGRLVNAARAIEGRGGRVVLVRFPSSGAVRAFEEAREPRGRVWEALVRSVAVPGIHFEDHPELRRFVCPDGSHLDVSDAAPFTHALARLLRARLAAAGDGRPAPGERSTP